MRHNKRTFITLCASLLFISGLCNSPLVSAAETKASAEAPISQSTADAILKELKEIRKVLEKIEKQGTGRKSNRPTTARVSTKGKQVMGSPDAPVTVVEFADYQCPFCLRFTRTTFPLLKKKYIDTGKVRWVALNLPLPSHKDAKKAAQAAHCAGEQDKFWEMREELFANPQKLATAQLPSHAAKLGLDLKSFTACLQSKRHLDEIDKDAKDANSVRLTGTPSFIVGRTTSDIVNGSTIIGAQPVNRFEAAIDKLLKAQAAANPKTKS